VVDQRIGFCHNVFRDIFAEVDDIWLEHSGAARTGQISERRGVRDDGVGVGSHRQPADRFGALDETGVERFQLFGQCGTAHGVPAVEADHLRIGAMQIDDVSTARLGVQQVDVLGDHTGDHRGVLECGQRPMTGVGQRVIHVPPADMVTCPVPLPECRITGELADGHGVARR
jgi:hypothetical protein